MHLYLRALTLGLISVVTLIISLSHRETALANDTKKAKAANKIKDPSFENGSNKWKGSSTFWDSVICDSKCDNNGMQTTR